MELKLFYTEKTSWTPEKDFYAIKVEKEFHPCTYQSDAEKEKYEAFIRGIGWKKSKKGYLIPLFKGTTVEELNDYIAKYGKFCAFYSITGFHLYSDGCVIWAAKQEFMVALNLGFEYVSKMVNDVNQLNDKILKLIHEKNTITDLRGKFCYVNGNICDMETDFFKVKIHYSLVAYFLCKPHIDPVTDDEKLYKFYNRISGCKEDQSEFPVSVKDRLTFLFSEEVSKEYERIMNEYPIG